MYIRKRRWGGGHGEERKLEIHAEKTQDGQLTEFSTLQGPAQLDFLEQPEDKELAAVDVNGLNANEISRLDLSPEQWAKVLDQEQRRERPRRSVIEIAHRRATG